MKLTTKDVKVVENPEFRMLNNRVGLFNKIGRASCRERV